MNELEQRLEDLYAQDARAWKVRNVAVPQPRGSIGAAKFIALTAVVSIAAIVFLGTLVSGRGQVGSPSTVATAWPGPNTTPGGNAPAPGLGPDRKTVIRNGQPVLTIDNDQIVQWFRSQSQLCDQRNIGSTADRRTFCTNTATFRDKTRFASISPSPDGTSIGFTIESDALAPDTVVGIFFRSSGNITFLTTYYLGHRFLGFSPSGTNFIYQGNCFEAKCGLYVRDSATLAEKLRVNEPVGGVERTQNATFVRWISDNEIEYKLGDQLKSGSF